MPSLSRTKQRADRSSLTLWIVLGSVAVVVLCIGLGIGIYFLWKGSGLPSLPGSARAALDPNDAENTAAWAAAAVGRIKDAEASKDVARTNAEIARVEKELKD